MHSFKTFQHHLHTVHHKSKLKLKYDLTKVAFIIFICLYYAFILAHTSTHYISHPACSDWSNRFRCSSAVSARWTGRRTFSGVTSPGNLPQGLPNTNSSPKARTWKKQQKSTNRTFLWEMAPNIGVTELFIHKNLVFRMLSVCEVPKPITFDFRSINLGFC